MSWSSVGRFPLSSTSSVDVSWVINVALDVFLAETMKLICWPSKAPADCRRLHRTSPSHPLNPALFFYPSLFFHMMLSHNAVKRSIWYWCLPTDVLLAFAVEILSRELNITTIFYFHGALSVSVRCVNEGINFIIVLCPNRTHPFVRIIRLHKNRCKL